MLNPTRVKVLKPLRICHFVLEVGDEFDITNWQETAFGTFFQPVNVDGIDSGMGWLFTTKTFEVVEWESDWQPSETIQERYARQSDEQDYYDNLDPHDMDGDFDSGMKSAGFGTDEDYGCFG